MQIAEYSEKLDLSPDTIRYYEKMGLIPRVRRTKGGIRDFSQEDLKRGDFVKCMRSAGLSIATLTKYFELIEEGDKTIDLRLELLETQRSKLVDHIHELNETLNKLDTKIDYYHDVITKEEKQFSGKEE